MKNFPRTGKKVRPEAATKGKRSHCASAGNEARNLSRLPLLGTVRTASRRKRPDPRSFRSRQATVCEAAPSLM